MRVNAEKWGADHDLRILLSLTWNEPQPPTTMDPLSIATGASSLVVMCVKVSAQIYIFIDETRQVDTTVTALCDEILALSRVLDAISKAWKRNPQIAGPQIDPDGNLWTSVKTNIDDCKATLEKLASALEEVQDGGFLGRGFLRRPTKQVKLSFKMKDIAVFQQRVRSYNSAMQSAMSMINFCLLVQGNSSQEDVSRTLSDLKSQIGRVEVALQSRDDLSDSRDEREETQRIASNLQRFVRAAESFHSSASTVIGDRSTVWGGSVLGDPLSQEQMSSIENWIPPPIDEEDEPREENASSTGPSSSAVTNRESMADTDNTSVQQDVHESDSDSDPEKELTKHFQKLAVTKLEDRDYEKAELYFQKAIDRSTAEGQPSENLTVIRLKLAFAYCFQGKWEEAEGIIVPIATGKQKVDISAFHGLHTLALLHFGKNELEIAHEYCRRALMGKKKLLGKEDSSYFESITLLSRIYMAEGDPAASEVYRSMIPPGHINELPLSPLDYLFKSIPRKGGAKPREVPVLVTPPVDTPQPISNPISQRPIYHTPINERVFVPANINPEKTKRSWRERLGVSSGGPRTPDPKPDGRPVTPQRPVSPYTAPPITIDPGSYHPQTHQTYTAPQYQPVSSPQHYSPPPVQTYDIPSYPPATSQQYYHSPPAPTQFLPPQVQVQSYSPPAYPYTADTQSNPDPRIRSKAQLIVGVDFGTTDTSVAWAFATSQEAKEDIITEWPGSTSYLKQRIPTVLYYDQDQKLVGWGLDIADALAPTGNPKPGIQRVEWFKLQLMLDGNTYIDPANLPPLPPGKSPTDVVADYLFKLRQASRVSLIKSLGEVFNREERNIQYCFTVPAVFNDKAIAALRNAIIQAGYLRDEHDNRLTFITEQKAVALFCTKVGLLNLRINDVVLIVDCGGGTVDLTTYAVEDESPFTISEATPGSGDSCGSTAVTRNFSNLLRDKIRKMKLPEGSKTAARVYAKCIMDFENRVKGDFRNSGQKWAADVGIEAEFPEAGIEDGYMIHTNDDILQCFEPVVDRILELVRNQIIAVHAANKTLKNILVIGTFGSNEYLFQQIKLHVPPQLQASVVRPMDSVAAVVKGAVTACITERMLTSRVSHRNYLVDVLQPFQHGHHPDYYCVAWLDGRLRCKYTYQKIWLKGQKVKYYEPIKISIEKFLSPGEPMIFEDKIYICNDNIPPEFTIDPKMKYFATCTTDLSKWNPESDFRKFRNDNGTFYLVNYHLYFTLDGSRSSVESVFSGVVAGRCDFPF